MRTVLSHSISSWTLHTDLSLMRALWTWLLVRLSQQASLLVAFGPAFVITRIVMVALWSVLSLVSAHLPLA